MKALLFVLSNLSAAGASLALTRAFFRDESPGARALIAFAVFPVVVLLTLILLSLARLLSPEMVIAVCAGTFFVFRALGRRRSSGTPNLPSGGPYEAIQSMGSWDLKGRLALAVLILASGPILARALLSGPHFSLDDLKYHAPYVTWWMQHGGFSFDYSYYSHAYYPFNAELFALWFVLPFGGDAFATLAGAYWAILIGVSLVTLLLAMGRSFAQALLLPALVITMAIVPVSLLRYAAVDVAGGGAIMAAMTLLFVCKPRPRLWILTGAVSGLALGSKLIFMPASVLLGLWMIIQSDCGRGLLARAKCGAFHFVGLMTTGSFWYLRNVWLTGNPVFPAQVGPFSGPMPDSYLQQTSLLSWITHHSLDHAALWALLRSHLGWPWPHFAVAVFGVATCSVLLVTREGRPLERRVAGLTLAMIAVLVLSYVVLPASAPDDLPGGVVEAKIRFLILPAILGQLAFALVATRSPRWWSAFFVAALFCVSVAWQERLALGAAMVVLLAGLLLTWRRVARLEILWLCRRYGAVCVIVFLFGLALWQPISQRVTNSRLLELGGNAGPGWGVLETLPSGSTIVSVGGSSLHIYPLFGRTLSLHPRAGDWRGSVRRPLHELWESNPAQIEWMDDGPAGNLVSFLPNMKNAGVNYVFLSRTVSGEWPPHLSQLTKLGDSCLCFHDEHVQIWKLPEGGAAPPDG